MDVKGAALFYTLATLSVTFAGFSALLLIVRQAAGKQLSALDLFLTRTVVGHLFLVTGGALLPPILALYDVPDVWIWKASGLLFGLPMLALLLTYQRRRIAATGTRAPPLVIASLSGTGSFVIVAMFGYLFGNLAHPEAAYASALAGIFLTHAFAFVIALEVILRQSMQVKRKRR